MKQTYSNIFKSFFVAFAILAFVSCGQQTETKSEAKNVGQKSAKNMTNVSNNSTPANNITTAHPANAARFEFEATEFDFGSIAEGKVVEHTFKFKNVGKSPLTIESTSATCGCTVPSHTKEPIAPGESGVIKVKFNSSGKSGVQNKAITITANSYPKINKVYLKGEVKRMPRTASVKK